MNGNKSWFIVDGYRPPVEKGGADERIGGQTGTEQFDLS